MKEITTNNGTFLFIEISDDAYDIHVNYIPSIGKPNCDIRYKRNVTKDTTVYLSPFFNFNVKIISTTKDITEKQTESIVEFVCGVNGIGYRDYEIITMVNHKKTAKESLQSLIQANGLDINKNYLIIKRL